MTYVVALHVRFGDFRPKKDIGEDLRTDVGML